MTKAGGQELVVAQIDGDGNVVNSGAYDASTGDKGVAVNNNQDILDFYSGPDSFYKWIKNNCPAAAPR